MVPRTTAQHTARQAPDTTSIIQSLRSADYRGALQLTARELAHHPNDCKLLSLKGVAEGKLAHTNESLQAFRSAIKYCPDYLPALEGAAQIEYAANDSNAVYLLKRIVAIRPDDPTSHAMLAIFYRNHSDCRSALPQFEASRPMFSVQPALLSGYGVCLAQTGKWIQAASAFQQLSAEHPSDAARYNFALAQWKAGRPKEALATLEPLLESGSNEGALALGAHIAEERGDTPKAVELLRAAILLNPDRAENYIDFARLAFAHNSFQVGIDMVAAGLKRLPNSAPLYVARGVLYVQLSQISKAVADFEHAHQLDPKLSFAVDAIGMLESQEHNDPASLAIFRQQVKLQPNDPLLQYLLAEALSQAPGDSLHEALTAAKKAVSLDPTYQPAIDLLAKLYLRSGDFALAVQEARIALKRNPQDEEALFQEIRAKRELGDKSGMQDLVAQIKLIHQKNQLQVEQSSRYKLEEK